MTVTAVACVVCIAMIGCDTSERSPSVSKARAPIAVVTPVTAGMPATDMKAPEYFGAYMRDVKSADALYLKRVVRVHGIVAGHGAATLELQADAGRSHIEAQFPDEGTASIRSLKRNDTITIVCRGGGMLDVPQLRDCVLEQVEP